MAKATSAAKTATPKGSKKNKKLTLMIIPFVILVFLFSYFPLHGWIYAFYDYKPPLPLSKCEFVGLQWFKMLFGNKTQVAQMIQVMKNTFAMSLLGIATSMLPLFFAILLNEIKCKWFKTMVQTLTTLPNFISWVMVYSVAKYNLGDRILKKQMQGYDVTQLKNILIDKGYLSGKLLKGTSLFDEETEKAVIKFQKSIGIDADGIVETQTVYFLKK